MVQLVNRARMTTPSIGTGILTLGVAVNGFQSFAAAGVMHGDQVRYVIEEGSTWEIGTGTYSSSGPTLTRMVTALRANKSETFEWLKFTLEGAGARTHGYAFTDISFAGYRI